MIAQNVRYEYWHPGLPKPEKTPEGCEVQEVEWYDEDDDPANWKVHPRRWPVPEHVWRANRYCEAFDISIPEGYEVIAFRPPTDEDDYLNNFGSIGRATVGYYTPMPILRKLEPVKQYRTPTDEDAKSRPTVEVNNSGSGDSWFGITLVAVRDCCMPFLAYDGTSWKHCRMEVKP